MNMFEYITRKKIRFNSSRGALTLEQLWDVPLRSRDDFNLNAIAKAANKTLKDLTEEDFVGAGRTTEQTAQETAFAAIKYVIETKLAEEEAATKRAERKQEKDKLLAILAEKQEGKLSNLSEKELQRRIDALE